MAEQLTEAEVFLLNKLAAIHLNKGQLKKLWAAANDSGKRVQDVNWVRSDIREALAERGVARKGLHWQGGVK